ncbi:DUF3472 domain-containing protein [Flavihumibacter sp. ZG627]|uniref:DUF3472 domain-containing protein n=1 Tax=Flavihumibacter sp. ZG627 TaxID=1463156 RepID=UPI00057CD7BA|nr:DUF5077 domain-containing protein [Flavihumibacter sp. ZG627]KIC92016.1 hypothetical protein HY58_00045 [Flavihumibacter sp. ZG627]
MLLIKQIMGWGLFLSALACGKSSTGGDNILTPEPIITGTNIPLGGNAYLVEKPVGATEKIEASGLEGWTNTTTVCAVYFLVEKPGEVSIAIKGRVPAGNSTIEVGIGDKSFRKELTNSTVKVVNIGSVQLSEPGYLKLTLKGIQKTGAEFAQISDIVVHGAAATRVKFANDPENFYWSRRGPSVHMTYSIPTETQVEWFYNELTVPVGEDKPGSFFMSNGFSGGYFGIQSRANDRWVLFSVWDPAVGQGTTQAIEQGENVVVQRFGGEGTGGQSYLVYDWKAGTTYRFLTRGRPDGAGNTLFSAWFYAPELNKWTFIATWKRPNTSTFLTGNHSFLENFYDENGWMERKVNFHQQWMLPAAGAWTEITSARFTADATARNKQRFDYAGGLSSNEGFFLRNGGFFSPAVTMDQQFSRPAKGQAPVINLETLPKK